VGIRSDARPIEIQSRGSTRDQISWDVVDFVGGKIRNNTWEFRYPCMWSQIRRDDPARGLTLLVVPVNGGSTRIIQLVPKIVGMTVFGLLPVPWLHQSYVNANAHLSDIDSLALQIHPVL
jgi:hypothetical protein